MAMDYSRISRLELARFIGALPRGELEVRFLGLVKYAEGLERDIKKLGEEAAFLRAGFVKTRNADGCAVDDPPVGRS